MDSMYDTNLLLQDSATIATDGAGTVSASAKIIDLGAGRVDGAMYVDVTGIEIASNDELYQISLQGSTKSNFADTYVDLAILELGANEVLGGDQDSTTGRYRVLFSNVYGSVATPYRYVREYCAVSGTMATGITFSAWLGK